MHTILLCLHAHQAVHSFCFSLLAAASAPSCPRRQHLKARCSAPPAAAAPRRHWSQRLAWLRLRTACSSVSRCCQSLKDVTAVAAWATMHAVHMALCVVGCAGCTVQAVLRALPAAVVQQAQRPACNQVAPQTLASESSFACISPPHQLMLLCSMPALCSHCCLHRRGSGSFGHVNCNKAKPFILCLLFNCFLLHPQACCWARGPLGSLTATSPSECFVLIFTCLPMHPQACCWARAPLGACTAPSGGSATWQSRCARLHASGVSGLTIFPASAEFEGTTGMLVLQCVLRACVMRCRAFYAALRCTSTPHL